jgi:RNA polymerase sigma factor (sigma-70 family)
MKDYLLQIKIKNAPMMELMRLQGYENAAELSRASGVQQSTIGQYLNLKMAPWSSTRNEWKISIVKLADCLKVPIESLFPAQHLKKCLPKNSIEAEIDLKELEQLSQGKLEPSIEDRLLEESQINILDAALDTLLDREKKVLKMRHGIGYPEFMTLHAIADAFSVTTERIRQIEAKALRKLRNPLRSRDLLDLVN